MRTLTGAWIQRRLMAVAGLAALASVGATVGVLVHDRSPADPEVAQGPFWSNETGGENLVVTQLAGTGWSSASAAPAR